ncbi:MAG: pentapeptide repeat-containing protein, partial [Candidatus Eremiobacteraeota bacterium]|nr:pentapeptide repeat-containing protein [Candidatus Eremiobacteraeota bacterium]
AALGLALTVALPPAPAPAAQDDLARQLIEQCVGCRFPKDMRGRDLHGVRFVGAELRDADFSRANLSGAQFIGSDLAGARFDDADLRNAHFVAVEFRGTSFARAKLDGVKMQGADFDGRGAVGRYGPYGRSWYTYRYVDEALANVQPAIDRAMREVERQLREHPPVMPSMPPMPVIPPVPPAPPFPD